VQTADHAEPGLLDDVLGESGGRREGGGQRLKPAVQAVDESGESSLVPRSELREEGGLRSGDARGDLVSIHPVHTLKSVLPSSGGKNAGAVTNDAVPGLIRRRPRGMTAFPSSDASPCGSDQASLRRSSIMSPRLRSCIAGSAGLACLCLVVAAPQAAESVKRPKPHLPGANFDQIIRQHANAMMEE